MVRLLKKINGLHHLKKFEKLKKVADVAEPTNDAEKEVKIDDDVMIECDSLVKIYKTKDIEVLALQGLDLTVKRGEIVAIIGNSGSGKSTFLNMIGGLDRPSAGRLYVDGKNLFQLTEKELVEYKRSTVGFVWQNNARNLLPYLSAWENVMTPMLFTDGTEEEKKQHALDLLKLVGLEHRKDSSLSQLSGGEQQRVAIAIALANNPKLLLADEPTGSVDRKTADYILDMFRKLNEELGITIVIVTHDKELAKKVNRVVSIRDGKTSSERIMKTHYKERLQDITINWNEEETQEEYAVLDRAGRVQIPQDLLHQIGVDGNKIKMEIKDGKIVIENPDE
ncbi:MAG: ABC transporter ATP-binding protein [Lachnospiraceae bacterium]|nr:ABC transporter ATP-binding protein [Lachnospiraceae bacterium]